MTGIIRLGSRNSRLAMIQAQQVADALDERTGLRTEIIPIVTEGDKDRVRALKNLGSTGVFTRELERELLNQRIDAAVHSLKDLPLQQPAGLVIAAILPRENPGDTLVVHPESYEPTAEALPLRRGSTLGTSSPRREALIATLRPDIIIMPLRGNVPTRLGKVKEKNIGAIILAAAGLKRLEVDKDGLIFHPLPIRYFPGAPGQGAIAVEVRTDETVADIARQALNHPPTETCVLAERLLLKKFSGGCSLPLGVTIRIEGGRFIGDAFLGWSGCVGISAHAVADFCEELIEDLFSALSVP